MFAAALDIATLTETFLAGSLTGSDNQYCITEIYRCKEDGYIIVRFGGMYAKIQDEQLAKEMRKIREYQEINDVIEKANKVIEEENEYKKYLEEAGLEGYNSATYNSHTYNHSQKTGTPSSIEAVISKYPHSKPASVAKSYIKDIMNLTIYKAEENDYNEMEDLIKKSEELESLNSYEDTSCNEKSPSGFLSCTLISGHNGNHECWKHLGSGKNPICISKWVSSYEL